MERDSLGIRLAFAFAILVTILMGVGWWGLSRMSRINGDVNEIFTRRWEKVQLAREAVYRANLNFRLMRIIFFANDKNEKEIAELATRRGENTERINLLFQRLESEADSQQERELLARIAAAREPVTAGIREATNLLIEQKKTEEARSMIGSISDTAIEDYHTRWDEFARYEEDQVGQARSRNEAEYATARRISTGLVLIAIFMATGIAVFVTRTLTREVGQREQARREIRKLNEGLEKKVAERTEELGHAVRNLEMEVSERKQKEHDLRRLAAIVESSDDAIIGESIDGTIVSWNASAERIYGYSAAEIIGQPAATLAPGEWPVETRRLLEQVKEGGNVQQFETIHTRKDTAQIPVALTVSPIRDEGGAVVGASVIARNISERKRMEGMFRQAQKMEAVGRLAGGVAHDFNNLLSVIIGYSDLLIEQVGQNSPQYKPSEQIKKAAERAAALTRQLLAFSRQQVLEVRVLNLNTVAADLAKMLPRLIGEDIELQLSLAYDLGQVRADPGQVEQVIMNLAINGRDAMPNGGKLIIETSNAHLNEEYAKQHPPTVPGDYVLLAITDTGVGMDALTRAHIFEPFFTTKQQGKGTGLGLATVYGVVKQSGGYIWVYSEPGVGSTFKVYLPRVAESVQETKVNERLFESPRRTETVLLVEDEQSLRALTRTLLEQNGYTVLEAESGSYAIEIASRHPGTIHLLLTDMVMPGMNGRAVAERLIQMRPDIRVVFMSGYTGFVQHGMMDSDEILLQKPFTRDALLRKLHDAIELQKAHTT